METKKEYKVFLTNRVHNNLKNKSKIWNIEGRGFLTHLLELIADPNNEILISRGSKGFVDLIEVLTKLQEVKETNGSRRT